MEKKGTWPATPPPGGGGGSWGTNATFLVQSVTPKTLGSTMDDQQTY